MYGLVLGAPLGAGIGALAGPGALVALSASSQHPVNAPRLRVLLAAALLLCASAPGLRAQRAYGVSLSAGAEVRLRTEAAPEQRLAGGCSPARATRCS